MSSVINFYFFLKKLILKKDSFFKVNYTSNTPFSELFFLERWFIILFFNSSVFFNSYKNVLSNTSDVHFFRKVNAPIIYSFIYGYQKEALLTLDFLTVKKLFSSLKKRKLLLSILNFFFFISNHKSSFINLFVFYVLTTLIIIKNLTKHVEAGNSLDAQLLVISNNLTSIFCKNLCNGFFFKCSQKTYKKTSLLDYSLKIKVFFKINSKNTIFNNSEVNPKSGSFLKLFLIIRNSNLKAKSIVIDYVSNFFKFILPVRLGIYSLVKYIDVELAVSQRIFFIRKARIFNKGRFSRNRQLYRTGVF